MALTFKLYRLRYTPYGADGSLEKFNEKNSSEGDFGVVEMSPVEETLERGEAVFTIGGVTLTVRGLEVDYFKNAESNDKPFVLEIWRDGVFLYHGIVDGSTAVYDQKTKHTRFTVTAWERLIADARGVAPRSVYETNIYAADRGGLGGSVLYFFSQGTPINVGDVLVLDGDVQELRMPVSFTGVDEEGRPFAYVDEPDPVELFNLASGTGSNARTRLSYFLLPAFQYVEVNHNSTVVRLHRTFQPNGAFGTDQAWFPDDGDFVSVELQDDTGEWVHSSRVNRIVYYMDETTGLVERAWMFLETPWSDVIYNSENFATNLDRTRSFWYVPVSAGDRIKILGADIYGATSSDYDDQYVTEDVLDALFTLGWANEPDTGEGRPLGIFANVYRNLIVSDGSDLPLLDHVIELPSNPLEAVRMIQFYTRTFARFVPVIDNDLPRVDVVLTPRDNVQAGDPNPELQDRITKWTERTAKGRLRAVVVRPNEDYRFPKGDTEYVGVWFSEDGVNPDNADQSVLDYMSIPTGPGVLEMKVPVVPSFNPNDRVFGAGLGGKMAINDRALKKIARDYWRFYRDMDREFSAEIADPDFDPIGQFFSFVRGDIQYTAYIASVTRSLIGRGMATIRGYIAPEFVPPVPDGPTAIITGQSIYPVAPATVVLNGIQSSAPGGGPVTYEWFKRVAGGAYGGVIGTGHRIIDVDVPAGVYDYKLVVTDPATSLTDEAVRRVYVNVDPGQPPPVPNPYPGPVPSSGEVYIPTSSGGASARVHVYITNPDLVEQIYWRYDTGSALRDVPEGSDLDFTLKYPETPKTRADAQTDAKGTYYVFDVPLANGQPSILEILVLEVPSLGRFRPQRTFGATYTLPPDPNSDTGGGEPAGTYIHTQAVADDEWAISHNMNAFPSYVTFDGSGNLIVGVPEYVSEDTLIIRFDSAVDGIAYLNAGSGSTGDGTYIHTQGVASADWVIPHALNAFPTVVAFDGSGNYVVGVPEYTDEDNITLHFDSAITGVAYLNA